MLFGGPQGGSVAYGLHPQAACLQLPSRSKVQTAEEKHYLGTDCRASVTLAFNVKYVTDGQCCPYCNFEETTA